MAGNGGGAVVFDVVVEGEREEDGEVVDVVEEVDVVDGDDVAEEVLVDVDDPPDGLGPGGAGFVAALVAAHAGAITRARKATVSVAAKDRHRTVPNNPPPECASSRAVAIRPGGHSIARKCPCRGAANNSGQRECEFLATGDASHTSQHRLAPVTRHHRRCTMRVLDQAGTFRVARGGSRSERHS